MDEQTNFGYRVVVSDCVVSTNLALSGTTVFHQMVAHCDAEAIKNTVEYNRELQLSSRRANDLFRSNFTESSKEYDEHGYYTLDSRLFPRLLYAIKPQLIGCFVTVYDRLRKPQEYQSVQYYKFGWMCIAQDTSLPEGDRLLQVGLMLRDHEREVLKTAYWCGSAWAKSPLKHIKKYLAGRKRKR